MVVQKEAVRLREPEQPVAGVFQIRNMANGKLLLGGSLDLPRPLLHHRTELERGTHRNRELQRDWLEHGPAAFVFEVIARLEPRLDTATSQQRSLALALLEEEWLDRLRPYDERGYNEPGVSIRQAA